MSSILRLLIPAIIFLSTGCADQSITVDGHVYDYTTSLPIAGVLVTFKGDNTRIAYTDNDGFFKVSGDYHTNYVTYSGFEIFFHKDGYYDKDLYSYVEDEPYDLKIYLEKNNF